MNTRSLYRVGLIMALFALLLAVSAVAAQDSQPGIPITPIGEDGPAAARPNQPVTPSVNDIYPLPPKQEINSMRATTGGRLPAANREEAEANNAFASATPIRIGDIVRGRINSKTDLDYFRIDIPEGATVSALIDIDATVDGSPLDAIVCVYSGRLVEPLCNDDAEGLDSLMLVTMYDWNSPYYIRVQSFGYPYNGGDAYRYKLGVYRPLLISATTDGTVAGIDFEKADVLAHADFRNGEMWKMFVDNGYLGITSNISGVDIYEFSVGLVLQEPQWLYVDGADQYVTPFDIIRLYPWRWGVWTSAPWDGFLAFYQQGVYCDLSEDGEQIDALAYAWVYSTAGTATIDSVTVNDEDLIGGCSNYLLFQGSLVRRLGPRNVSSADVHWDNSTPTWYLTIDGRANIDGKSVTQKDIFKVNGTTYRVTGFAWRGSQHHFPYNIDAFDIVD